MRYLTDRKRATGLGSARSGTHHHWLMMVTGAALVGLVVLFLFTFGSILGSSYEEVLAYYQRPIPAIIAILTLLVGFFHYKNGVQTLIEDYVHGFARKALIIGMTCLSYTFAIAGVFAIARIAL
ncbi:succinate dehydrogenase, hydrophobic membrane anchor protein [Aestuariibius sp. HNIBRBA575]|uniref:succinate dehydrogenase, hydrophobic membrane anchor protein n=1 Tax=Aestuariibius sp. HNIBRBA575 TaxID=3233343 RepID=UPI0034A1A3EB